MKQGKLIIFSAPSGAGKTSIVRHLLKEYPELEFSVSACSRPKRHNEKDGVDYHFLTVDEFKRKIENDEFVEWEEVYENQFYGTLKSELERIWNKNHSVIFDVDVVGGLNIKKQYPEISLAVFVMPPSVEELERRLYNRSTDSREQIVKRINKAQHEIAFARQFDYLLINDNLPKAQKEALQVVGNFLNDK